MHRFVVSGWKVHGRIHDIRIRSSTDILGGAFHLPELPGMGFRLGESAVSFAVLRVGLPAWHLPELLDGIAHIYPFAA